MSSNIASSLAPRLMRICDIANANKGKELESVPDEDSVQEDTKADADLHNFDRKASRTLYLLAKKNRKEHAWQFRKFGRQTRSAVSDWRPIIQRKGK